VFAAGFAASIACAGAAEAQGGKSDYPNRPVRVIVAQSPGGGADFMARLIANDLGKRLGQQFVVDNRPGAGSTVGTELVAKAPADGYTFLMTSASFSFNPGLYPRLRFDPIKDFTAVSLVVRTPHVIVVIPSLPVRNLQDLVKLARTRPGQVLYASAGPGSAMHLAGALFAVVTKTELTHVPYKGGPATAMAVISGEATTAFNTLETVLPLIRGGRLRPLAVSTRERAPALPDVPTVMEAGIKDYEAIGWFGLLAPAGTPPAIVEQLSGEIARAMAAPAMRERALQEGATPVGNTPAEFDRFVRAEIAKWTRVIQAAGIKLD